jgi:metalloendopeptidase OMA1, mitochondrial
MQRLLLIAVATLAIAGCGRSPTKGQQAADSRAQDLATAQAVFREAVAEKGVSADEKLQERVQRVGGRVVAASDASAQPWKFTVINDDSTNAFVVPGGAAAVNTGLMRIIESDDQLAAVVAALAARLGVTERSPRPSQQEIDEAITALLQGDPRDPALAAKTRAIFEIPSPSEEAEIDRLTLIYMARAGYDPRAAVALLQKPQMSGSEREAGRLARLHRFMPQAMQIYEAGRSN